MINVSTAFKAALEDDNRKFSGSCTITLNGTGRSTSVNIDSSQLWDNGFVVDDSTSNTGGFDIGSAIVQKFTLRLNNMYDDFTECDFTGAVISNVKVSLDLGDKQESVSKGIFTVNDTSYDGDIITLECLDNMHKFDISYEKSNLTYPATLLQIVQDACRCCGVTLATDSLQFEYYNYVIQEKPDDSTITFRDVLTWVGQISGHFWKCNKSGQLSAGWYNMSDLSAGKNIHTLQTNVVTDVNVDMDDVVITCIRIVTEDENSNQVTFQSGSDGYAIVIDSNKFINKDNAAEIASMVGGRVVGLRFRPMTVSSLQDPTIEAGDGAIVYDRKLKSYKTFFTNVVFSIDADNQMSNDAESALRNSAERFSEASKIYQDLKKHLNKNKTEWEKAMEELEKAMKEQVGLYPVIKTLDDGSKVYYMCDHQTLEESQVVFELNGKGWAVSTDGGNTWNAGLLVDGTMITKILDSIGINADWINTGAFTVLDSDGNIMFKADTATGRVDIVANSFQLRGKTLEEIAKESTKNYVDAVVGDKIKDINTQYFNSYDPTLTNKPASDWTDTDTKDKHLDDIFYNTTTKKMFRFVKIDGVYSWENFDDPDIKAALDAASTAQDTADGKRRVFLVTPKPPYDEGDMWVTSTTDGKGEIKICKTPRQSGVFFSADWISPSYVDSDDVDNAINEYDTSLGQPEIFNKLTNNGKNKGIYIQNGELYINASYILSGVLAGKLINGKGLNVTDKNGQVTLKIDDDGNVYIKATEFSLEGKNISDVVAAESDKFRTLNVILSNEYQGIPTDKDGKYTSFPSCSTTVKVLYGTEDVTKSSIIQWSSSSGVYGSSSGETYTVSGLSTDTGTVKVTVTRGSLTAEKIFAIAKQKQGIQGEQGQTGETGAAGATGNGISSITTYYLATASSSGVYTSTSGWTTSVQSPTSSKPYLWSYQTTYYTNGTSSSTSPHIIGVRGANGEDGKDAGELTQEQIFNILTNNGQTQGIYLQNGKVYINGSYIKSKSISASMLSVSDLSSIGAKIGGWTINSSYLQSSGGAIKLYSSGTIQVGNATIKSESNAMVIRSGLKIYCGTSSFSDGTDRIMFYNLTHVTSGGHMVFAKDGATVAYLSSSSKRYKDHVSDMTIEEAEKILNIPVIWFKYKKGYLDESDWLNGKQLPGFYAEDVYDIFPEATQLNEAGEPEDWNFRVMIPAMMKVIQNQNERINTLEDTVNALNERLNKLKEMLEGVVK
nr:MAG TPA: Putative tail protein [Caudoviricetes sp.]